MMEGLIRKGGERYEREVEEEEEEKKKKHLRCV